MHCPTILGACTITAIASALSLATPKGDPGDRPPQDGAHPARIGRSPVQRPARLPERSEDRSGGASGAGVASTDFRSIDGFGNNIEHPSWGSAGVHLMRMALPDYADGSGAPAGAHREGARAISNGCAAQAGPMPNRRGASDYLWQWGQFLDHDLDETPVTRPGEAFDIPVPTGDPWFDPKGAGDVTIPLDRSAYAMVDDVRQQFNNITAFIDASNVYGSEAARAAELRTLDGTGRLKTSEGDLLPFNVNGFDNAPDPNDPSFFLAGDVRANEQAGLTALHTLFVREHNSWADDIREADPTLSDDEIYEMARSIVGAEMQVITYREFLPLLLGPDALPPYGGYQPEVNAGVSNIFAAAAYRVGHTMLSSVLLRVDSAGNEIKAGHLPLASAFFNPSAVIEEGIEPILRGLATQSAQEIDLFVIDAVRNFLFGPPGAGGFDLVSLNIQRGRDHGLPSYNQIREAFAMPPRSAFDEISTDPVVWARLSGMYDTVDDIDAWVGLIAEDHKPGALVGETLFEILREQFTRLRDGDRFWYQASLPEPLVLLVEEQTLAGIIRRNTPIGAELDDDVFIASTACLGDVDESGSVGIVDLLSVLAAWGPCGGCPEDTDGDGVVGFEDLLRVLADWGDCP